MKTAVIAVLLLVSVGCTRGNPQHASNAVAGLDAVKTGEVDLSVLYDALVQWIASASGVKVVDLPPPEMSPSEIGADVAGYQSAAQKSQENLGWWAEYGGWLAAGVGVALTMLARVTGVGSALLPFINALLASGKQRRLQQQQRQITETALAVYHELRSAGIEPLSALEALRPSPPSVDDEKRVSDHA